MKKISILLGTLLVLAFAIAAQAGVTVNYVAGTTYETSSLTGYSTSGDDMVGMEVTALFSNGFSETLSWATTSATGGGISGNGWSLSQTGDTYSNDWTLSVLGNNNVPGTNGPLYGGLVSLLIDGQPGNTIFDTLFGGDWGTTGSAQGKSFSVNGDPGLDIVATYFDRVALSGQAPIGDLFLRLKLDFPTDPLWEGSFNFLADTDSALLQGDITPQVPVPAAVWLLGSGIVGLVGLRRKKMIA